MINKIYRQKVIEERINNECIIKRIIIRYKQYQYQIKYIKWNIKTKEREWYSSICKDKLNFPTRSRDHLKVYTNDDHSHYFFIYGRRV